MHELSLAEAMLDQIEAAAAREGARQVRRVVLEIGRLAAVDPDAMRFCFAAVVRNTVAEGAELSIVDLPGAGRCPNCGATTDMDEALVPCAHCGAWGLQPVAGRELRLREIEIV